MSSVGSSHLESSRVMSSVEFEHGTVKVMALTLWFKRLEVLIGVNRGCYESKTACSRFYRVKTAVALKTP